MRRYRKPATSPIQFPVIPLLGATNSVKWAPPFTSNLQLFRLPIAVREATSRNSRTSTGYPSNKVGSFLRKHATWSYFLVLKQSTRRSVSNHVGRGVASRISRPFVSFHVALRSPKQRLLGVFSRRNRYAPHFGRMRDIIFVTIRNLSPVQR